jgi:hypothetical protein
MHGALHESTPSWSLMIMMLVCMSSVALENTQLQAQQLALRYVKAGSDVHVCVV